MAVKRPRACAAGCRARPAAEMPIDRAARGQLWQLRAGGFRGHRPFRRGLNRARICRPRLPAARNLFDKCWLRVDLRPLETTAVVDVDRLPLGEELQRAQPRLAVAVARAACAAEG